VRALKTFWHAIRDVYDELLLFAGVSILWWLATLLVIPGPPVTAALYYLTDRVAGEQRIDFSFFREKFKESFGKSWLVAGTNLIFLIVLVVNIVFYSRLSNFLQYAAIAWLYLLLMWLGMQIYLFPLLYRMEEPRLWPLLRNALMFALARPGYTALLLVLLALSTVLSIILPLLLIVFWPALLAMVGAQATRVVIADVTERQAKSSDQEA
jgi:uncharacterized membrane protein YesL